MIAGIARDPGLPTPWRAEFPRARYRVFMNEGTPAPESARVVPKPGPHLAGSLRPPAVAPDRRRERGHAVRLHAFVSGTVQGVGFRWWTRSRALELGLVGTATNLADGRVEVVAEGPRHAGERLLELLSEQPPRDPPPRAPRSWYRRPGLVLEVSHAWEPAEGGITGFKEA